MRPRAARRRLPAPACCMRPPTRCAAWACAHALARTRPRASSAQTSCSTRRAAARRGTLHPVPIRLWRRWRRGVPDGLSSADIVLDAPGGRKARAPRTLTLPHLVCGAGGAGRARRPLSRGHGAGLPGSREARFDRGVRLFICCHSCARSQRLRLPGRAPAAARPPRIKPRGVRQRCSSAPPQPATPPALASLDAPAGEWPARIRVELCRGPVPDRPASCPVGPRRLGPARGMPG